ncbi:MAG: hypothetical protein V3U60_16510 [Gammaproteobacteria bacterium]
MTGWPKTLQHNERWLSNCESLDILEGAWLAIKVGMKDAPADMKWAIHNAYNIHKIELQKAAA